MPFIDDGTRFVKFFCNKDHMWKRQHFVPPWFLGAAWRKQELWAKYAVSMLDLAGTYYALSLYIEVCSIFLSFYCIVPMLRQIETSENRLVKQSMLPVTNNCQLMGFWCWAICCCAHSSNDCRWYRVPAKWHSFATKEGLTSLLHHLCWQQKAHLCFFKDWLCFHCPVLGI